ncbi:hypothetical protein [Actinoallomurus sp. CA-142502]|uniref:hypothetical protein n=1 Tax=Actinoallomurus sp. CA-142502 TaxID=3239885 RepID=UPI003D8FC556
MITKPSHRAGALIAAVAYGIQAEAYRASHQPKPQPAEPGAVGYHLVEPGDHLTYWGLDESLWGEPVTVASLCPLDFRCRVRLPNGSVLAQVDERGLFGGLR